MTQAEPSGKVLTFTGNPNPPSDFARFQDISPSRFFDVFFRQPWYRISKIPVRMDFGDRLKPFLKEPSFGRLKDVFQIRSLHSGLYACTPLPEGAEKYPGAGDFVKYLNLYFSEHGSRKMEKAEIIHHGYFNCDAVSLPWTGLELIVDISRKSHNLPLRLDPSAPVEAADNVLPFRRTL